MGTNSRPSLPGSVTLMGSGEMTAPMSQVYRTVMSKITGPVKPVFLDTPAGFQLNADEISSRAVAYFQHHFGLFLEIASFKSREGAFVGETERALGQIRKANLIFAGPGSPTYAVRNWKGSPIFEEVKARLSEGAHLVFSSAAAIAMGRYTLPVYEIYKVGEPPRWVEGIDLLGPYGLELAIMPHWNNAEGGTHDTRFTFMGEPRFRILEAHLPLSTTILGIDEYTAAILDLTRQECTVMGAGQVTLRHKGVERVFPSGASFPVEELRSHAPQADIQQALLPQIPSMDPSRMAEQLRERLRLSQEAFAPSVAQDWDSVAAMGHLFDLTNAMEQAREAGVEEGIVSQAREQLHQALSLWGIRLDAPRANPFSELRPWVELLVDLRSRLREAKQWALADEIRNRLSSLGILLEDTAEGTRWHRSI